MAAAQRIDFKESSFGPWKTSLLRGNSIETAGRFKTVGTISNVNSYMSTNAALECSSFVGETNFPMFRRGSLLSTPGQTSDEDEENKHDEARLIELAAFPGFNSESYTPLPHGLAPSFIMELVTNAQIRFATMQHSFRDTWKGFFTSKPSKCLFMDCFWWFFLQCYHPDQAVQDKLFCRISTNYVKVLLSIEGSSHVKDTLLKLYPDCIAQCVYAAFLHSFPNSWNSFDEQFRSNLCDTLYLWLCGVKPFPNSWEKWDTRALGPKVLDKLQAAVKESTQNRSSVHVQTIPEISVGVTDWPGLVVTDEVTLPPDVAAMHSSQADNNSCGLHKTRWEQAYEAPPPSKDTVTSATAVNSKLPTCTANPMLSAQIQGPVFSHVMFDVCGHSPLVQLYLTQYHLASEAGYAMLLKRTEVTKLPPCDAPTYQDVLMECTQAEIQTCQQFAKLYYYQKEAMQRAEVRRKQAALQHELEVKAVLSNRHSVQQLSNEIVGYKDHTSKSAISAAILKRLSNI